MDPLQVIVSTVTSQLQILLPRPILEQWKQLIPSLRPHPHACLDLLKGTNLGLLNIYEALHLSTIFAAMQFRRKEFGVSAKLATRLLPALKAPPLDWEGIPHQNRKWPIPQCKHEGHLVSELLSLSLLAFDFNQNLA
jgi:hypothetical protein